MVDVIATGATLVLVMALTPTVFSRVRLPWQTTVPTAGALFVLAGCMLALGVPMTAGITFFSAVLWSLLAVRSFCS